MATCIKQINPRRVIGVQAAGADAMVRSFYTRQDVSCDTLATIADGIAVKAECSPPLIWEYVDDMVTVTDDEIASTILMLLERDKMVVEPAGAAALAAAIGRWWTFSGKRAVCVLSGGNIDVGFIHRIVEKGLITRGRQIKFAPSCGMFPEASTPFQHCTQCGANIIMVQRPVECRPPAGRRHSSCVVCEVGGQHGQELVRRLEEHGYQVKVES